MPTVALARNAMNSRFELVLNGPDPVALRAAAEEALDEITRLDSQLSAYNPLSELTQINLRAAREPVRVEPRLFRLLQLAREINRDTGGAFDLTVAPLMRAWGFVRQSGKLPDPTELAAARECIGMPLVELDERHFTVRFARPGVMLDLGAIGKGFALERAERVLRDAGVTSALLHAGTSSVTAIGRDSEGKPWRIALENPHRSMEAKSLTPLRTASADDAAQRDILTVIELADESLSVSAVWGKAFEADGRIYGHVIDPRSGEPTEGALLTAIVLGSATEADAFSTALLTLGSRGLEHLVGLRPGLRAFVVTRGATSGEYQVASRGIAASSV